MEFLGKPLGRDEKLIDMVEAPTVHHPTFAGDAGLAFIFLAQARIKPNETGEIQVPVDGSLKTLLARAQDKKLYIPSGEFITVIDVIGSTMIVKPLEDLTSEE